MADWSTSPAWTAFEDINNGQRFTNRLSPEDFNKLAENIAYLYEHIGESEWLGEYVDGTSYKQGAIVSYYGDVYLCIKDLDDWQYPTNAEYWEMLNEEGGGGGTGGNLYGIEITPTKETQTISPEGEYDGFDEVIVKPIPEEYIIPSGTLSIVENGTHDVTEYASVEVAVPSEEPTLEEITITENGEYTPSGDGFSKVTVNVTKEKYDGSVVISAALLSGTWLIDSDKLYNLLLEDRDNVAQSISFSAGVAGSDAGLIYYDTMTFNFGTKALQYSGDSGTNFFSNYNYSAYGDGWKEYPDTSNGATVNFEEQAVSGNFYVLFTSIATKESE